MKNNTLIALTIGGAIIGTIILSNIIKKETETRENKLRARIVQLEANQTRLEERYTNFTNQYTQAYKPTNSTPISLEQIYEAIMPPTNQPARTQ